jgi:hypothetical protein
MIKDILHSETQWFRKTVWVYFVILIWLFMIIVSVYGLYMQLVLHIPFGDRAMSDTMLVITTFFAVTVTTLMLIFFLIARLETIISMEGIYYRFVPFINNFRKIKAVEIARYETRKYSPIKEFGGWGIRYNRKQKIYCYNVRGNLGILIELKNGKKILLGSQDPHKIKSAIDKLTGVTKI